MTKKLFFICVRSPVPVAASSGKIFQIDPSDHPVQRVCEQCFLSWDETPQRGFQLKRHQQTCVVCTDHLSTHTEINPGGIHQTSCYTKSLRGKEVKEKTNTYCVCVCTCRSSSREPPSLISPRGMSG